MALGGQFRDDPAAAIAAARQRLAASVRELELSIANHQGRRHHDVDHLVRSANLAQARAQAMPRVEAMPLHWIPGLTRRHG